MKIKEIYENKNPVFSFEIFPPNKNFPEEKLKEVTKEAWWRQYSRSAATRQSKIKKTEVKSSTEFWRR